MLPIQTIAFDQFGGGINQKLPPTEIRDDELAAALNVELDRRLHLKTRLGVTDVSNSTTISNKVTSVVYLEQADGSSAVFQTDAGNIRRWNGASTWTSVKGALTIGSGAVWDWVTFNDWLIGVNRLTGSNDNPVKITSVSGNGAALGGSTPPKGRYIEVANNRIFIVDEEAPNVIEYCALGDPEDWSTTGIAGAGSIAIGGNEGGSINGIKTYNLGGRVVLLVFKRRRIYAVNFGSPNTDTSQWEVEEIVDNAGTWANSTIQQVLNDLVFLSDEGILSLQALLQTRDPERARLSDSVPALQEVARTNDTYPSAVLPWKSQYWIGVPSSGSSEVDTVWVMDYSVSGRHAWFKFDGGPAGSAYGITIDASSDMQLFVGSEKVYNSNTEAKVFRYGDADTYHDDTDAGSTAAYRSVVTTKAFTFGEPLIRKRFHRFGFEFGALTDPVAFDVKLRLDEDWARSKTCAVTFSGLQTGGIWCPGEGCMDWGDNWASEISTNTDIWRTIRGAPGQRGQSIQFQIELETKDQGVLVKNFAVSVSRLTHKWVDDS